VRYDDEELLTVREVARRCQRSEETVRRWVWSGKLPARKLGNQLYVAEGELQRFQSERGVSESRAAYKASTTRHIAFGRRDAPDAATAELFRKYGYSPVLEDLSAHRGQVLPSREQELEHILDDEAFQDEVLAKCGPANVMELLRQVREE